MALGWSYRNPWPASGRGPCPTNLTGSNALSRVFSDMGPPNSAKTMIGVIVEIVGKTMGVSGHAHDDERVRREA